MLVTNTISFWKYFSNTGLNLCHSNIANFAIHCNKYDRNIPGIYSRFDIKIQNWQTLYLSSCPNYIDSTFSSPPYVFIDCRTGDISNFFKMLHNLLESLIIKWNLFILSSREQNFNQHLEISFSKENSCSKKLELTICAISGWLVVVWSLAVVYLKMLEGCWLLPDLRHLVSSLESSDPPLQTQIVHISLYWYWNDNLNILFLVPLLTSYVNPLL